MRKLRENFTFVGVITPIKDKEKKDILTPTPIKSKNANWEGVSFYCMIDTGTNGKHRLKLFGGDIKKGKSYEDRVIKINDDEIKVEYALRFNETILSKVPRYMKRIVDVLDERKEFLYQLDFIKYVAGNIQKFAGKKVKVTGDVTYSLSKDKLYRDFNVQNIELAKEDDKEDSKITTQIFYQSGCIDENILADGKIDVPYLTDIGGKVKINCFVETKNQDKGMGVDNIYYPAEVVIDMSKIDFTNERQSKMAHFMLKNFMVDTTDIYTCGFDARVVNAQEQKSYSKEELEQLLTDEEREYAEIYGESLDEVLARKQGDSIYGERINEVRLIKPNIALPIKTIADDVTEDLLNLYKMLEVQQFDEDKPKKEEPKTKEKESAGISGDAEFEELFG